MPQLSTTPFTSLLVQLCNSNSVNKINKLLSLVRFRPQLIIQTTPKAPHGNMTTTHPSIAQSPPNSLDPPLPNSALRDPTTPHEIQTCATRISPTAHEIQTRKPSRKECAAEGRGTRIPRRRRPRSRRPSRRPPDG